MNTKRRQDELKDFVKNAEGELVYTGRVRRYGAGNRLSFRAFMRTLLACCGVSAVSAAAAGSIRVPGMLNHWYVILPYAATLISSVLSLWGAVRTALNGAELREHVYRRTVELQRPRAGACIIFSAVTLASYCMHMVNNGPGDFSRLSIAVFPVFLILSGSMSYAVFSLTKTAVWD